MKKKTFKLVVILFIYSGIIKAQVGLDINLPSNPSLQVRTENFAGELGVATCDGCFSSESHTGDIVLRANGMNTGSIIIAARSSDGIIFTTGDGNNDTKRAEILNDGKMVIGDVSTPGNYGLYVEKGVLSERVKVAIKTEVDWADYVFESDYPLMPLQDVENFIIENKHLPEIPSAKNMTKNGLDVAEMDAALLKKIEELTLYIIKLNKEVQQLKEENEKLKKQ